MRRQQPRPQFLDRRVTPFGNIRADRCVERRQLRHLMTMLLASRRLTRRAAPCQRLRHIGHAYPQQLGYLTNPLAIVRRREHTLAQILRISLAPLVQHARLRLYPTGDLGITDQPRFGRPYDSRRPESALAHVSNNWRTEPEPR